MHYYKMEQKCRQQWHKARLGIGEKRCCNRNSYNICDMLYAIYINRTGRAPKSSPYRVNAGGAFFLSLLYFFLFFIESIYLYIRSL